MSVQNVNRNNISVNLNPIESISALNVENILEKAKWGGECHHYFNNVQYTQVLKATCEISDTDKTDQMNIKRICLKRSLSGKKCCMNLGVRPHYYSDQEAIILASSSRMDLQLSRISGKISFILDFRSAG